MPLDQDDFKKAALIELHDRGVVVHSSVYEEATAGWSVFGTEMETHSADISGGRPHIKDVAANILGPHLLAIRFVSTWAVGTPEEETQTIELTYSGSFTVWWTAERGMTISSGGERRGKRRDTLL